MKLVSKCPLFTGEEVGLAKAGAVFRGEERTIPELLAYFERIGSGNVFRRMCVLDAVILNLDWHYGNFSVPFDTDTLEIKGMAPVFDHNRSLFPELDHNDMQRTPLNSLNALILVDAAEVVVYEKPLQLSSSK